jgi:hypothetical protein
VQEVAQGSAEPVQADHDEGVAGLEDLAQDLVQDLVQDRARGQGPGCCLLPHAFDSCGVQFIDLGNNRLFSGGNPGVADQMTHVSSAPMRPVRVSRNSSVVT